MGVLRRGCESAVPQDIYRDRQPLSQTGLTFKEAALSVYVISPVLLCTIFSYYNGGYPSLVTAWSFGKELWIEQLALKKL